MKFQNDFALSRAVAMRLKHSLNAALVDECGEAGTCRCGKICASRFLSALTAESEII